MTTSSTRLYSNLAIPPGESLIEEIECRNITVAELAAALGLTDAALLEIFRGERAVTPEIAAGLEQVLDGIPADFWINLEQDYQETLARIAAKQDPAAGYGD